MPLSGLKVLFMGTPHFAIPTLQSLVDSGADIVAVVTQPDRPRGRSNRPLPSPVKVLAEREGLEVLQPGKLREKEFVERLASLSPDLIVVVAYGQILPKEILDMPRLGCVNVHASLLPKYRGAAPINWAVVKGEAVTGVTTMLMDEGLDTGNMLLKEEVEIGSDDAEVLYHRLAEVGGDLLINTVEGLVNETVSSVKQDDREATLAPMLKKEDGVIDWSMASVDIVNMVRGLLPWPTAFSMLGGKGIKIFVASGGSGSGKPGAVLKVDKESFEVAAGKGSIHVFEVQLEGKKRMKVGDFLKGYPLKEGEILGR